MTTSTISSILLGIYYGAVVIIDIVSWILYLLFLIFLTRCRLKNDLIISKEFFTLYIFNGLLDIIFVVEEYINYRIPQLGFFRYFYENILSYTTVAGVCCVYSLCQIIVISLSGITLSFNRYYAIKYPIRYREFWSSWRLVLLTIWPVIIVIPIFIYFCRARVNYISNPDSSRIFQNFVDEDVNNELWSITIIFHLTALIINGILNIILIKMVKKGFKQKKGVIINNNSENRVGLAMVKYAFIHFICFGMVTILEIVIVVSFKLEFNDVAYESYTVYFFAETVMVFFSPYALLILSKDIRIRFLLFIGLKKMVKISRSSVHDLGTYNMQSKLQTRTFKNIPTINRLKY